MAAHANKDWETTRKIYVFCKEPIAKAVALAKDGTDTTYKNYLGIIDEYQKQPGHDVIIADEAQFFTPAQIDQLRQLVDEEDIPVLCFGLRTDFLTHFFPGAQRLMELADSLTEIKTVCACGRKATVNARIDATGRIITQGDQVFLGGNDSYVAMCHKCWKQRIREQARE